MKKKLLAIILSVVMVVSVVAVIAACDGNGNYPEGLPVEKGKITFYVDLGDYEMPSYASPFLLGPYLLPEGETAWAPFAAEMTRLEGTNIWYYVLEKDVLDESVEKWNNYMIDLGYNEASGLPADKRGEAGSYLKSDKTAAPGGMDNPSFEYKAGDRVVNLGEDSFSVTISAPATNAKTTLSVTFAEALGEHAEVLFMGGFNGWSADSAKTTASADRKTWSLVLTDVLCTDYEYKILICEDTTKINQDTVANGVWDAQLNAVEGKLPKAYIEVNAQGGNMSVSITKRYNNSTISLGTLDLADVKEVEDETSHVVSRTIDTVKTVEVTFELKFAAKLEGYHVWLIGSLNGWDTAKPLELTSTDGITWTAKYDLDKALLGQEVQFKVVLTATTEWSWDIQYGAGGVAGADNAVGTLPAEVSGNIQLFGPSITLALPTAA